MKFLEKLSHHILDKYSKDLQNLMVILPNVRSRLFLNNYFKLQAKKAFFLPELISSKDFMERISGMKTVDDFFLLTALFNAYPDKERDQITFELFMNWGNTLLQDIKEIDNQLVDPDAIFTILTDIKRLDFWNPENNEISKFQEKYLNFCSKLSVVYSDFTKELENKRIGHQGLIERRSSEKIKEFNFFPDSKFIIAGFNALTKAEESVFTHLIQHFNAELIFDYDHFYVDDDIHEAGYFARKNLTIFNYNADLVTNDFKDIPKEVEVYKCATGYEQSIILADLLKNIINREQINTAVILSDESLLLPVLQNIPSNVNNINVTMGYSLQNSPYFEVFESLFKLNINAVKNEKNVVELYYFRDVIRFFNLDLIKKIAKQEMIEKLEKWQKTVVENNEHFISYETFNHYFNSIFKEQNIELSTNSGSHALLYLLKTLIVRMDKVLFEDNTIISKINREFLLHHMEVLKQVKDILQEIDADTDIITCHKIWRHYTKLSKVQFTGEPLNGLQIMGLLESRTLDFDHVIILNVNEGSLPSEKKVSTMIPNDLKRKFGMHLHKDKDAVISYHFYRLLQRSKNVKLLYSNQIDIVNGGEKSRYILQLKAELPKINSKNTFKEITSIGSTMLNGKSVKIVEKTEKVEELLFKKISGGLSPSSINNFINCSLNFYFTELVGLKNLPELTEGIAADKLGTALHKTLELLYKDHLRKILNENDIRLIQKKLPDCLMAGFASVINPKYLFKGKNLLTYRMAEKMINRMLEKEIVYVKKNEIKILQLESRVEKNLKLTIKGKSTDVRIKGFIDRIELKNGIINLIDYKSGTVISADLKIKEFEESAEIYSDKSFQLLTYASILSEQKEYENFNITAGIYPLKSYSDTFLPLLIEEEEIISKHVLNSHDNNLRYIIQQMFDKNIVLKHNENSEYCEFCI